MNLILRMSSLLLLSGLSFTAFAQQVYEADNGLTASGSGTARKVSLGGSLIATTGINLGNYNLNLTGTGNVGIRTALPGAPLHVYKNQSANYNPVLILEDGLADGYVMFQMKGTGRRYHLGVGNASEAYFGLTNKFFIWDQDAGTPRMVVDVNGNIGMGTTSPGARLSIAGATAGTSGLQFTQLNNTSTAVAGNGKVLSLDATGNVILVNGATGGGQVIVDPTLSRANDRIRIGGLISTGDGQNNIVSTSSDGGATYKSLIVERDGNIGFGFPGTSGWVVGNPVLRISSGGLLSILSQNFMFGNQGGPINSSSLMFSVSSTNEFTTGASYPNGVNTYSIATLLQAPSGSNKRAPLQLGGRELRFMIGGINNVEAARVSETGNLMIGTTTDNSNKLQVNGTVWASGLLLPTGAGAGKVLTSDASGNATWQTASGSGTAGWAFTGNNSLAAGSFIGTTDATPVILKANNVEGIRIGTNGSVGIGTQAINDAGYKLFVEGNIRSRKVRVDQATWADYVFDKDYTLLPLAEVEKYIAQHKHLPDVPSAAEVAKEGLDLGDNQAVLLKKIEELTLYMIEQNKVVAQQNQLLKQQQARIEALEKKTAVRK